MISGAVLLEQEGAGAADGEEGSAGPVVGLFEHSGELGLSPVGEEELLRSFKQRSDMIRFAS